MKTRFFLHPNINIMFSILCFLVYKNEKKGQLFFCYLDFISLHFISFPYIKIFPTKQTLYIKIFPFMLGHTLHGYPVNQQMSKRSKEDSLRTVLKSVLFCLLWDKIVQLAAWPSVESTPADAWSTPNSCVNHGYHLAYSTDISPLHTLYFTFQIRHIIGSQNHHIFGMCSLDISFEWSYFSLQVWIFLW